MSPALVPAIAARRSSGEFTVRPSTDSITSGPPLSGAARCVDAELPSSTPVTSTPWMLDGRCSCCAVAASMASTLTPRLCIRARGVIAAVVVRRRRELGAVDTLQRNAQRDALAALARDLEVHDLTGLAEGN